MSNKLIAQRLTYPSLEQGSSQWLQERCGVLTASTIGKLITPIKVELAENTSAQTLIMTLVGERISGYTIPVRASEPMQRGVFEEPIARKAYERVKNVEVTQTGFIKARCMQGWELGYSPDGLVGETGLIEIKSRDPKKQLSTFLSNKVPEENMAQIQCGLYVSGRKWCDYVSFCGGMPLFIKRVTPIARWFEVIEAAWTKFETQAEKIMNTYGRIAGTDKPEPRTPFYDDDDDWMMR